MNELASPKPNRRRRLALRFAALVLTFSALGAAYWFTRPPDLVWWRSPPLGQSGKKLHALIPYGWQLKVPIYERQHNPRWWSAEYSFFPVDRRPKFLRYFYPAVDNKAFVYIDVLYAIPKVGTKPWETDDYGTRREDRLGQPHRAEREIRLRAPMVLARIHFVRRDASAFNRTYKQICNSLRIE